MLLVDEIAGERQVLGDAAFTRPVISVRELVQARIELELEAAEDARLDKLRRSRAAIAEHARGYAGTPEVRLNGAEKGFRAGLFTPAGCERLPERETLFRVAEEGFTANAFFVLLDDRQADSLDELIEIDRTGEATFLLLTPLQGG